MITIWLQEWGIEKEKRELTRTNFVQDRREKKRGEKHYFSQNIREKEIYFDKINTSFYNFFFDKINIFFQFSHIKLNI